MKPVEEMNAEELIGGVHLQKYPADFTGNNGFGTLYEIYLSEVEYNELLARLRERDAAKKIDFLGNPHQRYNDHKNGWNDAISSVRSAMLAARERKE